MGDITLFLDSNYGAVSADVQYGADDLVTGHDLRNAVLISLFSDALVGGEGGWWADCYSAIPIGSRLFQFYRSTKTSSTRVAIINAVRDCLAWMISDGIAATVDVDAYFVSAGGVQLTVDITQPSGTSASYSFSWAWANP